MICINDSFLILYFSTKVYEDEAPVFTLLVVPRKNDVPLIIISSKLKLIGIPLSFKVILDFLEGLWKDCYFTLSRLHLIKEFEEGIDGII